MGENIVFGIDFSRYWPAEYYASDMTTTYSFPSISTKPPLPGKESPQNAIDRSFREALEKPKIEAEQQRQQTEVSRRIELAGKFKTNDEYEFGTVLRWTRKLGKDTEHTKATEYRYVAIKAADGKWYVSGQHQVRSSGWKLDDLIEWMLTGETTIENLQIATAWNNIF